jgi:hypothetical protein
LLTLESAIISEICGIKNKIYSIIYDQNYPNPFNPVTKINFNIPKSEIVTLKIYDILGKEVAILMNEIRNAGKYLIEFNAKNLSSGVYLYRIEAGDFKAVKQMLLLK